MRLLTREKDRLINVISGFSALPNWTAQDGAVEEVAEGRRNYQVIKTKQTRLQDIQYW